MRAKILKRKIKIVDITSELQTRIIRMAVDDSKCKVKFKKLDCKCVIKGNLSKFLAFWYKR